MKKPTFIDLFAGAGGFGLGFQMAGFKPLLSVEVDKWAAQTLSANNKHRIINDDITIFNNLEKIKAISNVSPDIIIGGPPCQGFSVAGANRVKNRAKKNELFRYFLKWVEALEPKAFVIENVPGILTKKTSQGIKVFDTIEELSKKMGYAITVWRLNAANYGVPQNRNRVFIVGTKVEKFSKPKPTHRMPGQNGELSLDELMSAVTVGEAILDLPTINAKEGEETMKYSSITQLTDYQKWARKNSKMVYNHVAMQHTDRVVKRYKSIIDDVEMPNELKVRKRNGGGELSQTKFNQNYRHLVPDKVAYTIPASFYSSFIHPIIPRNITTREAARLQSFPDYYVFKGKRTIMSNSLLKKMGKEEDINLSQYNQVGNAVPPLLGKAVAEQLIKYIG